MINLGADEHSIFLKCDCGCEVLCFSYNKDIDFSLSIFSFEKSYSIFRKLRHCIEIFRTGNPYKDQMCLSRPEVEKLRDFLNETIKLSIEEEQKLKKENEK